MRRMKYPRAVALVFGLLAACASSRPEGNGIDAADDTTDAADTTGDGSDTTDAPDTIDAPGTVDSSTIDSAMVIDAAPSDGVMPIDAPIDANTCPTSPCDIYAQCGCTSPLVCDLDFTDLMGNSCRAVNQVGTETSSCSQGGIPSPTYCAGGYVCLGNGADASCERYCDSSSDCGQPRGQCVVQVTNSSGAAIPNTQVCSSNCNPVNSAAGPCPPGQGKCGFFYANFPYPNGPAHDIVQCTAPGAGTQGATCGTFANPNDALCAANFMCSSTNGTSVECRRVCNLTTGGNECAAQPGTTCGGFNPALVVGGATYGICR